MPKPKIKLLPHPQKITNGDRRPLMTPPFTNREYRLEEGKLLHQLTHVFGRSASGEIVAYTPVESCKLGLSEVHAHIEPPEKLIKDINRIKFGGVHYPNIQINTMQLYVTFDGPVVRFKFGVGYHIKSIEFNYDQISVNNESVFSLNIPHGKIEGRNKPIEYMGDLLFDLTQHVTLLDDHQTKVVVARLNSLMDDLRDVWNKRGNIHDNIFSDEITAPRPFTKLRKNTMVSVKDHKQLEQETKHTQDHLANSYNRSWINRLLGRSQSYRMMINTININYGNPVIVVTRQIEIQSPTLLCDKTAIHIKDEENTEIRYHANITETQLCYRFYTLYLNDEIVMETHLQLPDRFGLVYLHDQNSIDSLLLHHYYWHKELQASGVKLSDIQASVKKLLQRNITRSGNRIESDLVKR